MISNVLNRLRSNFLKGFENHIKKMSEISQTTTEKSETNEDNLVDKKTKKPKLEKEERKRLLKLRRQAKKEVKSVGFYNETLKETDYYFENGLRKVYPYFFFWNTTVKG
jgi:lysosomal alpha-mannosidase